MVLSTSGLTGFRWALIGPGNIAGRFAEALAGLAGMQLHSVHGRDPDRAAAFARRWSVPDRPPIIVETELHAMLADPHTDAVYIATPHSSHGGLVRRCLEAGKPVLCEKPLVFGFAEAQALITLSRCKRVFLMEGLWTRLLPVYAGVRRWLDAGEIGAVRSIQSSFGFSVPYDARSRLFDPVLGGGTLLDIGVYNLAMTRWVLEPAPGECPDPSDVQVTGVFAPSGVDQRVAATLVFDGGVVSQFVCAFDTVADNSLHIHGERGAITVLRPFWEATDAVLSRPGQVDQTLHAPWRVNGFEEQIEEVARCVRQGRIESERVPHHETLALRRWTDILLGRLGVHYPNQADTGKAV